MLPLMTDVPSVEDRAAAPVIYRPLVAVRVAGLTPRLNVPLRTVMGPSTLPLPFQLPPVAVNVPAISPPTPKAIMPLPVTPTLPPTTPVPANSPAVPMPTVLPPASEGRFPLYTGVPLNRLNLGVTQVQGLEMDATRSDTASLVGLVDALFDAGIDVHFMRDPTRGGVSAVMHELAEGAGVSILLDESSLPISEPVRGARELLGLDPLYVANEGKLIVIVSSEDAEKAQRCLRRHPLGERAAVIG
jgi:AIR synthase related protein, C-terminal domain